MPDKRRHWLGSVRVRATLGAFLLVSLLVTLSAVAMSAVLRRSLVTNLRTSAELRAADVSSLVRSGRLPDPIAEPGPDEDLALVQVVDASGRVQASSPALKGEASMDVPLPHDRAQVARILRRPSFEDDEDFVVVARRTASPEGAAVVYVAATLKEVDKTVGAVDRVLVIGVPLVLLAVGLTSWLVVGRALEPVERMRAEVAEISGTALHRRVPVPEVDDEVGRLARTMNLMLDRLEAAHERQRRFVADASHELRSPLASTRTQLEVGLADSNGTDWPTTAREILDENQRLERLVQDLLFMARADSRLVEKRRVGVDLDDLVLSEVARVRDRQHVRVDISGVSAGQVVGDPDSLVQVVRNLVENAERHARTIVRVQLRTVDNTVELVVVDDGEGIPPAHREKVFDRFTRLDGARTRGAGGTGLGLAIAKEIVESHRGTIAVEECAAGTRLAVRLPASDHARI